MSVFRVKLNNTQQGTLDVNPATNLEFSPSIQRTMYVAGPKKIYRKLVDGATFTDSNYWKRFAYPQVALVDAFIEVVTDDGSVYSDVASENVYPLSSSYFATATNAPGGVDTPIVNVKLGTAFSQTADNTSLNVADILGTFGGPASFLEITNFGTASTQDIQVRLNGSVDAVISLPFGVTKIYDSGDLSITKLEFKGGSVNTTIQFNMAVRSVSNS